MYFLDKKHVVDIGDKNFYKKIDAINLEYKTWAEAQIITLMNLRKAKKYMEADAVKIILKQSEVDIGIEKQGVVFFLQGDAKPYFVKDTNG